jgi:hypothetical protein
MRIPVAPISKGNTGTAVREGAESLLQGYWESRSQGCKVAQLGVDGHEPFYPLDRATISSFCFFV